MLRRLLLIFILTSPLLTIADASPKFSEQVTLKIVDDKGQRPSIDSICVIVPGWETKIATLHYDTEQFWTGPTLRDKTGYYILFTHGDIRQFIVVAFVNSQKYVSTTLPRYFGDELFILKLDNGKLIDISPFFHSTWYSYFGSLILTLLVEVLLGLIFFYKNQDDKTLNSYLLTFILVNIATHFSLWLIYSNALIPLFFLELSVVTIEFVFWRIYLKVSNLKAFLISLLTNFVSWTIGGLLTFFV
jgi:hypothetical protein